MHPDRHLILGVHVTDRVQKVGALQQVFTDYGCYIKTRLGLHEASAEFCSPNGLILLELLDDEAKKNEMVEAIRQIEGIEVQEMNFAHP